MISYLGHYTRLSRTPWYSLIFIIPLVVLYELLAVVVNWDSPVEWRNGADVVLRQLLEIFGLGAPYIMGALAALGLIGAWLWQRRNYRSATISGAHLIIMLVESSVWAVLLLIVLLIADQILVLDITNTVLRTSFLALGAGIYEEGIFRLLVLSGLILFFCRVLAWHPAPAIGTAVLVSALLFALFHYVGPAAQPFDWNSFSYRGVAGIFLGLLYQGRGFGITVYTHTFYDLFVIGIRTLEH